MFITNDNNIILMLIVLLSVLILFLIKGLYMYSKSLPYDSTINIQSDLERSRRFGSGVYPDYSNMNPVRNNIANASISPAQRNMHQSPQESSTSRDSVAANLRAVVGGQNNVVVESPSSSVGAQPSVSYNLNLRNVFSNLNTRDPFQAFILEPGTSAIEDAMYNAIACKDLPLSVKQKPLDWPSEQARNLLGIISQDVLPEDRARLKKSFSMLERVQHNSDKEPGLGKDISFLLHKYGKTALYRHVETYTECCRKVWHYYNPGHTTNPKDDVIFKPDAEVCYRALFSLINQLTLPNQIWGEIVCNGLHFKNSCGALGVTINIDPKMQIAAESITETFDSVYLNNTNNLNDVNNQNDYEIESDDGTDSRSLWKRIVCSVFCGV